MFARGVPRSRASGPYSSQVPIIPGEDALQHVALVLALLDRVAFARVDDELGGDGPLFQGLVELLRLRGGHRLVVAAMEDQRGRADMVDVVEGRELLIGAVRLVGACLPEERIPCRDFGGAVEAEPVG